MHLEDYAICGCSNKILAIANQKKYIKWTCLQNDIQIQRQASQDLCVLCSP